MSSATAPVAGALDHSDDFTAQLNPSCLAVCHASTEAATKATSVEKKGGFRVSGNFAWVPAARCQAG